MFKVSYRQPVILLLAVFITLSSGYTQADWNACQGQANGIVIPIEYNCHGYIYCRNQLPNYQWCTNGQAFSTQAGGCVNYAQSDCANGQYPNQGGTCNNEKRPENQQACKRQAFGALVPYPGNCAKFLVCNCEYPTVKDCPSGTWFDNKIKTCNYPQNVQCDDGSGGGSSSTMTPPSSVSTTGSTEESTPPEESTTDGTTPHFSTPWDNSTEYPNTCDNEKRPENQQACKGQAFGAFVPYPGNCAKYLICYCEYPTVKDCPPGTLFDNKIKTCSNPQNVQCDDGSGGVASSTMTPSSSVSTTSSTEESTLPGERTTDGTTPHSWDNTTEYSTPDYSSTPVVITTTESNSWGENCEPPEAMSSDICLKYPNGVLLKYPYNCNAYINCTHGCPVMQYCQHDKVFNNMLKICDTPDTAECIELPMPGTTSPLTTSTIAQESSTESSTSSQNTTASTTTAKPAEECIPPLYFDSNVCSSHLAYEHYPYNCSAYVFCRDNKPCLGYCENGQKFDSNLGICNFGIECDAKPLPAPTTTELPITTTTSLPANVNPNLCQGKEDYSVQPYAEDCSQYLQCYKGEVKVEKCPQGWLFNARIMMCDEGTEEECFKQSTTIPTETTPESTTPVSTTPLTTTEPPVYELCIGKPENTTFPYKENCHMYYFCLDHGHYYIISCPHNNYYDPYSGNCGPDVSATACQEDITPTTTQATTLSPEEKCENQPAGTTFPYEANCEEYIFCNGKGGYYLLNCPYGNYYYPNSGDCGPSDDVNICRQPLTSTTSTSTTTTTATTPTTSTSSSTSTSTTTSTTTTTTAMPELPALGLCGTHNNGDLIPYPGNCHKYISCVRPIPIGFYCTNNWYFNKETQTCVPDWQLTCADLPPTGNSTALPPSGNCKGLEPGDRQVYTLDCQLYYECLSEGYSMLKSCTENQYFDPLIRDCSAEVGQDYCKQNFNTTTALPPASTTPSNKPQGICEGQALGAKIPDPYNCSTYIDCVLPIPVAQKCAYGLEFSSQQQKCVPPNQSDCGYLTSTPQNPTTKPLNLCWNKPDFILLPYEENCARFIICLDDMEHWAYCPPGENFDLMENKCLANASQDACRVNPSTETPETTTISLPTTTQDPNLGPCFNQPEGSRFPYPHNCSKYIECRDPLAVGYDCPEGLEFSVYYKECVLPELADCSSNTPVTTTEISIPTTTNMPSSTITAKPLPSCSNLPNGATFSYPQDCSKYYICVNGLKLLTNCMPNTYYNPETGDCESDISPTACQGDTITTSPLPPTTESTTASTTTTRPQGPCQNEPNGYVFANIANCGQYYMCLKDMPILCECSPNSFFDPYAKECNPEASESTCKEALTTTSPATNETTTDGVTTTSNKPINPQETTTTTDTATSTTNKPINPEETTNNPQTTTSEVTETSTISTTTESETTTTTSSPATTSKTTDGTTTTKNPPTSSEITTTTPATPEPEPETGNICCGQKSNTYLPYPGESSKYVICKYPVPEVHTCPVGMVYDAETFSCKQLPAYDIEQPDCDSDNYGRSLIYVGDCNKYYFCFGSEAVSMTCNFNWYFNPNIGLCVPPDTYTCPW